MVSGQRCSFFINQGNNLFLIGGLNKLMDNEISFKMVSSQLRFCFN